MANQKSAAKRKPAPSAPKKLDYITVKGLRSIQSIEKLELRPINLLIGAKGSGKSNFLEAFALLRVLGEGKLAGYTDANGGAARMLHFGPKITRWLELEVSFSNRRYGCRFALQPAAEDRFVVLNHDCWFPEPPGSANLFEIGLPGGIEAWISKPQKKELRQLQNRLTSMRIYHFHDTGAESPLKRTANLDDNRFLREDASNLASFLDLLAKKHPSEYQLILKTVQSALSQCSSSAPIFASGWADWRE